MSAHEGNSAVADDGFVPFFRRYTKTWVHHVATAGLTAFGTLTFVNRWFAVLALGSYVVPPVALYLSGGVGATRDDRTHGEREDVDRSTGDRSPGERRSDRDREAQSLRETDSAGKSDVGTRRTEGASADEPAAAAAEPETEEPPANDGTPSSDETLARGDEAAGDADESDDEWRTADVPATETLFDAVVTDAGDAYAVGSGGLVVADRGQGWTTVLEAGPAAQGNDLRGIDATADGEAVWVAGDSGAVGRIDAETGRHTDHTAPADLTDNLLGLAVGGSAGDETVLLINGSGEVLRGRYAGESGTDDGPLEWDEPIKPGSGSSLAGIALADDAVGYCCDTNDGVFETEDGGRSFAQIGLEGADGTLEDIATAGRGDCLVSADDGVVHRYGGASGTWTPERVADVALPGLARHADRTVACGADGAIRERTAESASWERLETDADATLLGISIGSDRGVAVGEEGTVLERHF